MPRSPDQLVEQALRLLAEAGALEPWLTVSVAATLACVTNECIRTWIRAGDLEHFYDRRLRCFLVRLGSLRRAVLEKRGMLSNALFDFDGCKDRNSLFHSLDDLTHHGPILCR
jgi:hypothetical protein